MDLSLNCNCLYRTEIVSDVYFLFLDNKNLISKNNFSFHKFSFDSK